MIISLFTTAMALPTPEGVTNDTKQLSPRWEPGRCRFHVQVHQYCKANGGAGPAGITEVIVRDFKDNSGIDIPWLKYTDGNILGSPFEIGWYTTDEIIGLGYSFIMKWENAAEGNKPQQNGQMTYIYKGDACYWTGNKKSNCGSCGRGDWTGETSLAAGKRM